MPMIVAQNELTGNRKFRQKAPKARFIAFGGKVHLML